MINFSSYSTDDRVQANYTGSSFPSLTFWTSSTERMRIDNSGNVGIGTTNPEGILHLKTTGPAEIIIEADTDNVTETDNACITFKQDGSIVTGRVGYEAGLNIFEIANAYDHPQGGISFRTATTTKMFVANDGSVGIGTTNPSTTLDVAGDISVQGSLSKGSGSFKIDHPLKPSTHYLVHSFIEGPQADNLYRGKAILVNGSVTINLDEVARMTEGTFIALNRNVQCFTTNETGWTPVRGKVEGNILSIKSQSLDCNDTISWIVIGERHDQHIINANWTDDNGQVITEPIKSSI